MTWHESKHFLQLAGSTGPTLNMEMLIYIADAFTLMLGVTEIKKKLPGSIQKFEEVEVVINQLD